MFDRGQFASRRPANNLKVWRKLDASEKRISEILQLAPEPRFCVGRVGNVHQQKPLWQGIEPEAVGGFRECERPPYWLNLKTPVHSQIKKINAD